MDFHGEERPNQTHESKTDPDAFLARKSKGKEAKLSYSGNLLVENRNGMIVSSLVWEATGTAERDAAMAMLQEVPGTGRLTVGGDKKPSHKCLRRMTAQASCTIPRKLSG